MVLKTPKWGKFVKINTGDVNVRKAPSTNSPMLMSRGADLWMEFSWTPKKEFEPFRFEAGTILPVLKETSEWYCLYFDDHCYSVLRSVYEVYVMKKFCTEVTPITMNSHDVEYTENQTVKGNTGYLMGVYYLGSPSRAPWCRLGHKVGKYIVMADYDGAMEFAQNFITGENVMEQEFDIEKINDFHINKFIRSKKEPNVFDVWIKFAGENTPRKFVFDANRYHFPIESHTIMAEQTLAQKHNPSDEIRVVKLTSNDVNLRQEPSAKSARLIRSCGGEGPCSIEWSSGTLRPKNSWGVGDEPLRTQYLAVVETVKGDDGQNWLHCVYSTNISNHVRWDVYVMEKFTTSAVTKQLFTDNKLLSDAIDHHYFDDEVLKLSGEYKDRFVGVTWDDMESCGKMYIGRYLDGVLMVDYVVLFSNEKSQKVGSFPLYVKDGTLYFDKRLYSADCYLTGGLDLHKLCANANFLSRLMKVCNVKEFENPRVFCAVEGEDEWLMF